ncbi:molybdenum cofactor biosynthesis protein MoaE [Rhodomicrobium udaipurense JA643]|uniref:Molybdopterin synthase catalytic subunit n=1 Tax=Rhodomicrobium udaipurense TaxID=1202716 RepID=A0A8I1G8I4_9HYPH|nr:molybdenum cofactor biosynthesis protein MoaE [Rhodomicrobium udaipurense]KAI94005.1 molybdenum cofactor biosynthesis protein MoaE [Rhodomicrobium udaipurense JA643]MBJ7542507.1 molybdenum cofactor biosynthesis protein MoaE [Rhodomicrobium udaipurense]
MIRVQTDIFDPGEEMARLGRAAGTGAIATFVGLVRDEGGMLSALTLEHYPGMTERALAALAEEARGRWSVGDIRIVHRVGRMLPGEVIVFVGVAARHRAEAFAACEFLIDRLKTDAPLWKFEEGSEGGRWVDAHQTDNVRAERWR